MAKKEGLLKTRWLGRKKTRDEEKAKVRNLKDSILFIVRHSILAGLQSKSLEDYIKTYPDNKVFEEIEKTFKKDTRGVRVSLYLNGNLRGSKGSLTSNNNLYDDLVEYSRTAAFNDERFPMLKGREFKGIEFDIFLIEADRIPITYKDPMELLVLLDKQKDMGVMVKRKTKQSHFLPDTWEQIPDPGMFISSLCTSADLPSSIWRGGTRLWPSKIKERRRDLYTGKIVEPKLNSDIDVYHIPVQRIKGRGKNC